MYIYILGLHYHFFLPKNLYQALVTRKEEGDEFNSLLVWVSSGTSAGIDVVMNANHQMLKSSQSININLNFPERSPGTQSKFYQFTEIWITWSDWDLSPCRSRWTWRCGDWARPCRSAARSPGCPRCRRPRRWGSRASSATPRGSAWRREPGRSRLGDEKISKLEFRMKSQFHNSKLNFQKLGLTCSGFANVSSLILPEINLSFLY